jgi:hypothetical protein
MRVMLFCIFLISAVASYSKELADSLKNPVKFSGSVSLNSNGISPIPIFALGEPAISASLAVEKGRFSYDPTLSFNLELKPWFIDNWFHYKLIYKPKFELRTGVNVGSSFSDIEVTGQTIRQVQRYFALELAGTYKISEKSSLGLMLWYDKGADPGTIQGYFINVVADKSDIGIGKHLLMAVNLQTFVINYTDNNDGFFFSPKVSFSTPHIPVFIFYQGIHPLASNISPYPSFQWNVAIGYSF